MAIELPKIKSEPKLINPRIMVLYAGPKVGKTSALAQLEDYLIIDLEQGTDFLSSLRYKVENLEQIKELGREIIKAKKPYKGIIIDTVTELEDWCVPEATRFYKTTVMGKNFAGNNVLELPNGAGYLHLRTTFQNYLSFFYSLADRIILVGHLKDREIEKAGKAVSSKDIDLTGKLKTIVCAKADAVGFLRRKEKDRNFISFIPSSTEEVNCGSRCAHLSNKDICLSEIKDGNLITHWDSIFLPE